ncbi:pyruvate oxidase [Reinekea sp. MED297]|uniref:Pyruvate oxidase n=1 Tax=Reinekea blandensis MED297 TaxID=314283 RepID=A4BAY9_9GAMM|nr:pyruvate oxidase [Reinekea sp. MED297] [Reinekea blandensis MED297]
MKNTILLIFTLLSSFAFSESLEKTDFIGEWKASNESTTALLIIADDFSGSFKRGNGEAFVFSGENIFFQKDIAIIELYVPKLGSPVQKLMLSGWKLGDTRKLYGMVLMYDSSVGQFNGINLSLDYSNH